MRLRIVTLCLSVVAWSALSLVMSCSSGDPEPEPVDCTKSNLAVSLTSANPSSCSTANGSVTATGTGGTSPYQFSINGGAYQTSGNFQNLAAGSYEVSIKDASDCSRSATATISAPGSTLAITFTIASDTQCLSDNGSLTVSATGGTGPYQFQLGTGSFSTATSFTNLKAGQYAVTVKDAANCVRTQNVTVTRGNTGTSYASQVKAIIESKCGLSGCHDAGTGSRDFTNFTNVKNNAANIKTRTANKSMPPAGAAGLSQTEIDLIACWVDDGAVNN